MGEPTREPKRVIAIVTDAFAPFHRKVLDAAVPLFSTAGFGTLCVTGRDVSTQRFELSGASGPEPISSSHRLDVAGAVIVSGATPPGTPDHEIAKFVDQLTTGPVVSLGISLPGVPSVTITWDHVIADLMRHMTLDPSRQRFVFIQGCPGDLHSEEREAGFRAGLAAAGRTTHEELIVCGNYSVADSMLAVRDLLASGQTFDGVIAGNDDMAIGAIAALEAAGQRVPDDVIVAGFDDSLEAFTSVPPLTSARLDTARLVEVASNLVIGAIRSDEPLPRDLHLTINSQLLVRASSSTDRGAVRLPSAEPDRASALVTALEVDRAPRNVDVGRLVTAAMRTLQTGDESLGGEVTISTNATRADIAWWSHAAQQLRRVIASAPEQHLRGVQRALRQLGAIDQLLDPARARHHAEANAHQQLQARLMMLIASCSDSASLYDTLRTGFTSLGMNNAWIVVGESEASDGEVRLAFSLRGDDSAVGTRFARSMILPAEFGDVLESDMHVLVPLRAGSSDIGYLVVEPTGDQLLELEAIATGIAQVLRHVDHVTELDRLAGHDSLTGLPNRKRFVESLSAAIERRVTGEVAVLLFDLDGFKRVNDTRGHDAGDRLLVHVGQRVSDALGGIELFRLGGDEFTIIVEQPSASTTAADTAARVLAAIDRPIQIDGESVQISASIGVACAPHDGDTVDTLVRCSDRAMYASKADRHRRVSFADSMSAIAAWT